MLPASLTPSAAPRYRRPNSLDNVAPRGLDHPCPPSAPRFPLIFAAVCCTTTDPVAPSLSVSSSLPRPRSWLYRITYDCPVHPKGTEYSHLNSSFTRLRRWMFMSASPLLQSPKSPLLLHHQVWPERSANNRDGIVLSAVPVRHQPKFPVLSRASAPPAGPLLGGGIVGRRRSCTSYPFTCLASYIPTRRPRRLPCKTTRPC